MAGNGSGGDAIQATLAQLLAPRAVTTDSSGNIYVAETSASRIRKVTRAGTITTVAGNGTFGFSGDGGPATSAELSQAWGVASDSAGNLYIADTYNSCIRKVTPAGTITTVAGNGNAGYSGDGGPATSAQLAQPNGLAVDAAGNLYIADVANYRIRKVTPAGLISTVAGNGTSGFSGDGGSATAAQLSQANGVAVDGAGNVYIADTFGNRVRKVTPQGTISTVAGNGNAGYGGDEGPATLAQLDRPSGIAVDAAGNLYIADWNNCRIRRVTPAGTITTIAGSGQCGYWGDGGSPTSASLAAPRAVTVDTAGNLYTAESQRVREVTPAHALLSQVVVGGGYRTVFTFGNNGSGTVSGTVTLTDQKGNPLTVSGIADIPGIASQQLTGSSFPISIPPGGVGFITTTSLGADDPVRAGWAHVDSTQQSLYCIATFQYFSSGTLESTAGVMPSEPTQYATIPVDYDVNEARFVGYAVANSGDVAVTVKLSVVDQSGKIVEDSVNITLSPGQQVARFINQDLAMPQFKGSIVLSSQAGSFVAVALMQNQSRLTVVPVIAAKAPNIP